MPSLADMLAYNAARTPQARVTLGSKNETTARAGKKKTSKLGSRSDEDSPSSVRTLTTGGGVFPSIYLIDPAGSGAGGTPPSAAVTLQFSSTRAGALAWVSMRDGGNLSALDEGVAVDAEGGFFMKIAADGTVAFTYQAPAVPGRYQVCARLDNVTTVLPFIVPIPQRTTRPGIL